MKLSEINKPVLSEVAKPEVPLAEILRCALGEMDTWKEVAFTDQEKPSTQMFTSIMSAVRDISEARSIDAVVSVAGSIAVQCEALDNKKPADPPDPFFFSVALERLQQEINRRTAWVEDQADAGVSLQEELNHLEFVITSEERKLRHTPDSERSKRVATIDCNRRKLLQLTTLRDSVISSRAKIWVRLRTSMRSLRLKQLHELVSHKTFSLQNFLKSWTLKM